MKISRAERPINIARLCLVMGFLLVLPAVGSIAESSSEKLTPENMSANEIIQSALTDSLYY